MIDHRAGDGPQRLPPRMRTVSSPSSKSDGDEGYHLVRAERISDRVEMIDLEKDEIHQLSGSTIMRNTFNPQAQTRKKKKEVYV